MSSVNSSRVNDFKSIFGCVSPLCYSMHFSASPRGYVTIVVTREGLSRANARARLRPLGVKLWTFAVISPTFRMLADSTLATFLDLTRTGGVLRAFHKADMTAQLVNGTNILFRSADEPDRLRGTNLGWFFLDEGALCEREVWLILIARLREAPGRAWVCTTPRGFDWLWETFVKNGSVEYAVIRSSTRENPYLPADFVSRLEQQYTATWQQQEIEGEFCELEGALFKRHWFQIVEYAPHGLRWSRYWDLAASNQDSSRLQRERLCSAIKRDW